MDTETAQIATAVPTTSNYTSASTLPESNKLALRNNYNKQLSIEMPSDNHIVHDQNLDECSNFTTLTETSSPTLSSDNTLSPTFTKWKNIGQGTDSKWKQEIFLHSSNFSIGSSKCSKGTLQTAATGTTYTVAPDSITAASDSRSMTNDGADCSSDRVWFGGVKLRSVKQNEPHARKLVEREEVKPGLDEVDEDVCIKHTYENGQQHQDIVNTTEHIAKDNDAETIFPIIQQASTITTVGTTSCEEDDDDDCIVYYCKENDEDPLACAQLPPPTTSKLDPTGMHIYLTQEEIYDPTLLDSSFEIEDEDHDEDYGKNNYTSSNKRQMFRTPSDGNKFMGVHAIERIPSGTSSISFSCTSISSSASSTSGSDSGYANYYPSSLSVFSYGSAANRSYFESDLSMGSSCGSITASSDSGDCVRVSQADVMDMGSGAIAISCTNHKDGPVFGLVSNDSGIGLNRNENGIKDDDEDDGLKNAYLPSRLLTPPRVERRGALTNLSHQDDHVKDKVESAYLPFGLCTLLSESKDNTLPLPQFSAEGNDVECTDNDISDNSKNLGDKDNQSCIYFKHEDHVPYDEIFSTSIDMPPLPNPENPPLLFRTQQQSPIPSTVKPFKTALCLNHTSVKNESSSISCCDSDAISICSSDHTQVLSNCSPPRPIALDNAADGCTGFLSDNYFLSILDCPGRKTRKKREKRNKSNKSFGGENNERKGMRKKLTKGLHLSHRGTKKISKMIQSLRQVKDTEEGSGNEVMVTGEYRWGESAVRDVIGRMKGCNRLHQENRDEQSCENDVLSSMRRRQRCERSFDSISRSCSSSDKSSDFIEGSKESVIQRWERQAMGLLQRTEFEEALSLYHKILCSYRSHINQCKLVDRDATKYEPHVGTTLHNIGIVYLLSQQYDIACEWLQKASTARASCLGFDHMDYIVSVSRTGLAYYAQDQFLQARQTWQAALDQLRRLPSSSLSSPNMIAELSLVLNNLACVEFEIGQVENAARVFREALEVYHTGIVKTGAVERQYDKDVALKLAILRSNAGYVWLRMKKGDLAIAAFEAARVDQEKIQDSVTLLISMLDHLVLAYLRKGQNSEALRVYSALLKIQIETYGPNHAECQKTLTKINLLEAGMDCNHLTSATKKVKDYYLVSDANNNNQRCHHQEEKQLERFEKLLKVPNTWGRVSLSVRSKYL